MISGFAVCVKTNLLQQDIFTDQNHQSFCNHIIKKIVAVMSAWLVNYSTGLSS